MVFFERVLPLTTCGSLLHVVLFSIGCVDAYNVRKAARMGDTMEKGSFELQYSKDMEQGSM